MVIGRREEREDMEMKRGKTSKREAQVEMARHSAERFEGVEDEGRMGSGAPSPPPRRGIKRESEKTDTVT